MTLSRQSFGLVVSGKREKGDAIADRRGTENTSWLTSGVKKRRVTVSVECPERWFCRFAQNRWLLAAIPCCLAMEPCHVAMPGGYAREPSIELLSQKHVAVTKRAQNLIAATFGTHVDKDTVVEAV